MPRSSNFCAAYPAEPLLVLAAIIPRRPGPQKPGWEASICAASAHFGDVASWHFSDVTARADDVSSLGESRHCGCEYLRSDFDPRVRPLQPRGGGWSNLWSLSAQDRWG